VVYIDYIDIAGRSFSGGVKHGGVGKTSYF